MSKNHEGSEKSPAAHSAEPKSAPEHKPEHKSDPKPDHKKVSDSGPSSGSKSKGHAPLEGSCFAVSCKRKSARFNFCEEHYDHFKFGLIKKTGEMVSDHEKKFEHFLAMKQKQAARKVA